MQYLQKTTSDINTFPTAPSVVGEFISSSSRITKYCPYSPGLAFWLDGIDKGPVDNHWTDLINGVSFMPQWEYQGQTSGTTPEFNDKGVYFNGSSWLINTSNTLNFNTSTCTIECVYHLMGASATQCLFYNYTASNILFALCGSKNIITSQGDSKVLNVTLSGSSYVAKDYIVSTQGATGGESLVNLRTNQNYTIGSGDYLYSGRMGNAVGMYPTGSNTAQWLFTGTIYSIRIYNRQLSAAEMVYNQKIDNKRFNLGLEI